MFLPLGDDAQRQTQAPRTPVPARAELRRGGVADRDRRWGAVARGGGCRAGVGQHAAAGQLRERQPFPSRLRSGCNLSVQHWAADGLLAVFFFVAGIELKRELVAGICAIRRPRYCPSSRPCVEWPCPRWSTPSPMRSGADPSAGGRSTATDIAFALAVLAVIGTSLPSALRAFLLTLAVVDDLFAILIIAIFFTDHIDFGALGGAVVGLGVFWVLLRKGVRR